MLRQGNQYMRDKKSLDARYLFFEPLYEVYLYSDTSANEDNSFRNHIR